jgi:hypothetical protein
MPGSLESSIEFFASERAHLAMQRNATRDGLSSASDACERLPATPRHRRRRRRKQAKSLVRPPTMCSASAGTGASADPGNVRGHGCLP